MGDYKDDLKINIRQLHREWKEHPEKFAKWADKWLEGIAERDRIAKKLEVLEYEYDNEARKNADEIFSKKPTETAIANWVQLHPDVQKLKDDLIEANKLANYYSVAKTAFLYRTKALENEVKLYLANYYSLEDLDGETKSLIDQKKKKEVQKEMGEKLRRKKRGV